MNERNARKIRAWLALQGIRQIEIAKAMGLSAGMIGRFITGQSQSQRVFEYFMSIGCPREFFVGRPEAKRAA